jgi:beta-barrel assembly-enhancing protease
MMSIKSVKGTYFDGETAFDHEVVVEFQTGWLNFSGPTVPAKRWSIAGLHPIDPPNEGQPFRLSHDEAIGARLIIRDQTFIDAANPELRGHYGVRHMKQVAYWTIGGLAAVAALGWFTLTFLPGQIAGLIPNQWRENTGKAMETSVVGSTTKACNNADGVNAMGKLVAAIAEGDPNIPPLQVNVYDIPIMNAFAVSGGRVIFTRELIERADNAEEVAGVLAHEIGHVANLHPEEQLVRLSGLQLLMSIVTGSNGGDMVTNLAGMAAILRYSREAEREADTYARETLTKAKINTLGFKTFFEKLLKFDRPLVGSEEKSALDRIGSALNTHPDTEDRIKAIQPLPAGITPVKLLTDDEWQALKAICK